MKVPSITMRLKIAIILIASAVLKSETVRM